MSKRLPLNAERGERSRVDHVERVVRSVSHASRIAERGPRNSEALDGSPRQIDREEPVFTGSVEPVPVESQEVGVAADRESANEDPPRILLQNSNRRAL